MGTQQVLVSTAFILSPVWSGLFQSFESEPSAHGDVKSAALGAFSTSDTVEMFWSHCLSLFFGTLIYLTELFDSLFASVRIRVLFWSHRWFILLFLCLRLPAPHLLNCYILIGQFNLVVFDIRNSWFKAESCLFWEILLPKQQKLNIYLVSVSTWTSVGTCYQQLLPDWLK